ncbi:MAG: flagellar biosynthesis anti-sigma factor FlgM [Desulfobacterales bacterium]|nr:flagellar biosynthesis anti-sigma factor FlgM [Desulfobacterales bacterium]
MMNQVNGVQDAHRGPTRAACAVGKSRAGRIPDPRTERGKAAVIPGDRVGVSDLSRKMRMAMEEATSLPTETAWVRKVAALGGAVREGSYIVNADKVAARMLWSSLSYAADSPLN